LIGRRHGSQQDFDVNLARVGYIDRRIRRHLPCYDAPVIVMAFQPNGQPQRN
jgi:hypothetical protein